MKKIIAGLVILLASTASFAGTYECKGYLDNVQVGPAVKVNATKTPIAEDKSYDRMTKGGVKLDYVRCKKIK
ncbi:hypothetical protein BJAS_P0356 [Bathymodiolus japonicus methanotrophic gill symbiont]|uniref:hypothetical protein n=1 Tax=Bathymodiolus japonicus methanotrophic gill symbiont TaxID=113269 RepID=UPI001B435220|nr:hypothetical protein [Bathymodiolus japonicus methanotrophic gill symbiont]GFO71112.1 hypothetical protein BJAS_P0356 [Bathymodiolus japonicus methanotrophic gill symbiont]